MLIKIFAAASAVATAAVTLTRPIVNWYTAVLNALIMFAGGYISAHLAYLAAMFFVVHPVDMDEPVEKPTRFWQWTLSEVADTICTYLGARVHVSGEEKLPTDSRFLLVCNHRSGFDPIVTAAKLRDHDLAFISKDSNFKIPYGGKVMHKCGCLAMNRENNREALVTVKRATEMIKNDVLSMAIYPEGTRNRGAEDSLLPFHNGSFKIAQKAGVPVVVATIRNCEKLMKNFPLRKTDVYLDIIDVIPAETAKSQTTAQTAQMAQSMMLERLKKAANDDV